VERRAARILAFSMVRRSSLIETFRFPSPFPVTMTFLVSVYGTRGSENLDSPSTFSESEFVARQPCEEELLILAF
jgi:hypothetical protein